MRLLQGHCHKLELMYSHKPCHWSWLTVQSCYLIWSQRLAEILTMLRNTGFILKNRQQKKETLNQCWHVGEKQTKTTAPWQSSNLTEKSTSVKTDRTTVQSLQVEMLPLIWCFQANLCVFAWYMYCIWIVLVVYLTVLKWCGDHVQSICVDATVLFC